MSRRIISPDDFNRAAGKRLENMGVVNVSGTVEQSTVLILSKVYAGQFYDDVTVHHSSEHFTIVYDQMVKLKVNEEYSRIIVLYSLQCDYMGRVLPDPVWWLTGHNEAMRLFLDHFIIHLSDLSGRKLKLTERETL